METDDLGHLPSSTLRRSNSAPNVSAAVVSEAIPIFQPLQTARQRRFSTSQMAVNIVSKNSANKCQERIASFWHYFPVLSTYMFSSAIIIFSGQCHQKWWIFTELQSSKVNVHHYSPPLWLIIVNQ